MGESIFILFVVAMALLFMILLLKRLCRKPNPMDVRFASWNSIHRPNPDRIQSISIVVHQRGLANPVSSRSERLVVTSQNLHFDATPPPPFESVVLEPKTNSPDPNILLSPEHIHITPDYELPPPSYEEYLEKHEKIDATMQ